jgi:predicted transcriptional regulator
MTERRVLRIEISTPQAAMEAFAQTWERLERGEAVIPIESIGFESLSEMLSTLTPRRWELIQTVKRRGPTPIGDLVEPVEHDQTSSRTDVGTLVDLGILEIDDRQRVFVPWDEIDLRVPLAA